MPSLGSVPRAGETCADERLVVFSMRYMLGAVSSMLALAAAVVFLLHC